MSAKLQYAADPAVRNYFAYERAGISVEEAGLEPIRFGEYLVERGALGRAELFRALATHYLRGGRLGEVIAELGLLPPARLEQLAFDYHNLHIVEG